MKMPLQGIKIIDLTRILSGPYITMTLADLGAEVIKIESPEGDNTRQWGPPFIGEDSTYYQSINRNKKSLVLNLKTEKGKGIFLDLIKDADVVIENFKPKTIDKLGIGYDVLQEYNPRIILASISGFGQTGPYAEKPGYDILATGMGGFLSVTGEPDGPPVKAGFSIADLGTGMWAGFGILVALWNREKSGEGQWVDLSLLDTMVSWQTYIASNYFSTEKNPKRLGGAHPNIVPYQIFEASDGHFVVAVGNEIMWKKFVGKLNFDALRSKKFELNKDRVENREELILILNDIFKDKPKEEWIKTFESINIPSGPVNEISEVFSDPQVIEREMVYEKEDPETGPVKFLGTPLKFSKTPSKFKNFPPKLGEHSNEILKQLGYTNEEIEKLEQEGVTTICK
ncbi:formyl-CoA transferase [Sporosarcina ureae]|nr:formyl-CoA transferase [Sporosarcina ureae]